MSDSVQVDTMTILVQDVQAAQKRVTETSRAYVEARAELRALKAHYTRIMEAAYAERQASEVETTPGAG